MSAGVLYIVDSRFGNCSFLPLAYEAEGPVVHLPNGRVIMPSAFEYFKLENDFTYNGEYTERGSKMKFYVTQEMSPAYGPLFGNVSTVLGVSSDNVKLIQADGSTSQFKPLFLEFYFTEVSNTRERR